MWWFWNILEVNLEKTRSCPSNQSRVNNHSQTLIDKHPVSSIESEADKARLGSQPSYSPISTTVTEIPIADFNLIFIWSAIVLGNTCFSNFHISHQIFLGFLIVWRQDPRLLQSFVFELQFFYSILFMHLFQIIDYWYVSLCYVWVIHFLDLWFK